MSKAAMHELSVAIEEGRKKVQYQRRIDAVANFIALTAVVAIRSTVVWGLCAHFGVDLPWYLYIGCAYLFTR